MNIDISKIKETFGFHKFNNKFRAEITLNKKFKYIKFLINYFSLC